MFVRRAPRGFKCVRRKWVQKVHESFHFRNNFGHNSGDPIKTYLLHSLAKRRYTVDPPHGRSAPGQSSPFAGRSAPPSWSIRPVEFEGREDRGNEADRPRRCTRSFRPTRMSRLNESTCETISHTYLPRPSNMFNVS